MVLAGDQRDQSNQDMVGTIAGVLGAVVLMAAAAVFVMKKRRTSEFLRDTVYGHMCVSHSMFILSTKNGFLCNCSLRQDPTGSVCNMTLYIAMACGL